MSRRSEWAITRLKYVADCNQSVMPEDTDPEYMFTYVDISNVSQGFMNVDSPPVNFAAAPSRARRVAAPGDTVVSTVRTYLRAVATVPETDHPLVFSTGFAVLHPKAGTDPDFLSYYLQGDEFVDRVVANSTGVSYPAITPSDLIALELRLPAPVEQRAIADFLDGETEQIDALLREQRRLIATLRERRIALISRTVTKGLDNAATLADSGVDWLGGVPTHWDIKRLKYSVASTQTGVWGADPTGDEDDVLCVRVADFERPKLRVSDDIPTVRSVRESDRLPRLLEPGDLLLEKSGGTALNPVGFVAAFEGAESPAVSSNFLTRLRPADGQDSRYWLYAHAASYSTRLTARSVNQTTGIQNLDQASYFNEMFPYPPVDEQRAIAGYLDEQTSKIDELMHEADRFIDLARERRSALITAAVTGRIDVRGEVA